VASAAATLTVSTNVSATALSSQAVCPGDPAQFSTTGTGGGPFNFAWYKDGVQLAETNNILYIPAATVTDVGAYSVVVSGPCGSLTNSANLTLKTVTGASSLNSLVRCVGDSASFTTVASGSGPFSYVWQKDGTVLGETSNTLNLPVV